MANTPEELHATIDQLQDKKSPKRRSAARRLRRIGNPIAGPALLAALRSEVRDPRTWETQYQMIMALGECRYREALPFLEELAQQPFEATMIYVALGDALVRLARGNDDDPGPVLALLDTSNEDLIAGALRAAAMLHLRFEPDVADRIVDYVSTNQRPLIWVVAAAAGWRSRKVESFLKQFTERPPGDLRQAARASLEGKYLKWNPL